MVCRALPRPRSQILCTSLSALFGDFYLVLLICDICLQPCTIACLVVWTSFRWNCHYIHFTWVRFIVFYFTYTWKLLANRYVFCGMIAPYFDSVTNFLYAIDNTLIVFFYSFSSMLIISTQNYSLTYTTDFSTNSCLLWLSFVGNAYMQNCVSCFVIVPNFDELINGVSLYWHLTLPLVS